MISRFLKVYGTIFIFISCCFFGYLVIDYNHKKNEFAAQSVFFVALSKTILENELELFFADLRNLEDFPLSHGIAEFSESTTQDLITERLVSFMQDRPIYDQIRILDLTGREYVRINKTPTGSQVVPEQDLQNKSSRYYFTEAVDLKPGQIYVSPFDLNMENGEIERPLKPMLRAAIPLFNSAGDRIGVLVLNYLGVNILNSFRSIFISENIVGWLLNSDGYWLSHSDTSKQWGFMFDNDNRLQNHHEVASVRILKEPRGQFVTADYIYTFESIPVRPNGDVANPDSSDQGQSYHWKIVAVVPTDLFSVFTVLLNFQTPVLVYLGTVFLSFFLCLRWVQYREKYIASINEIKHASLHDSLTGLGNRRLLELRAEMCAAYADRNGSSVGILYLDLDGFKPINDTYGHQMGDTVLVETAHRLKAMLRKSDTVIRVGGDEFVIMLAPVYDMSELLIVASKVRRIVTEPIISGDVTVQVSTSIGVAAYPDVKGSLDQVIRAADHAMYQAKHESDSKIVFANGER